MDFLFSKKFRPKVGGTRLKNFWWKFFHNRVLNETDSGFSNLKDEWLSYDAFHNQVITISTGDGNRIQGRSQGVNDAGSLEVVTDNGVKTYASGEVTVRSDE